MEWVETIGRTVEEAKDAALDQLGVDEHDAEFEVIEEPRTGLFGRVRGEARARTRARVAPRPQRARPVGRGRAKAGGARRSPAAEAGASPGGGERAPGNAARGRVGATPRSRPGDEPTTSTSEGINMDALVTVGQQADIMEEFLEGLLVAFGGGADATVSRRVIEEDTIELAVEGGDLGLLIGPKGQTLQAVQDLARTVVQRRAPGSHEGRVRIDMSGYRQRRREALERFTQQMAEEVQRSGAAKVLEPMGAADRKVVHDTVNPMDGVATSSEGEEPRRHVVIRPDRG